MVWHLQNVGAWFARGQIWEKQERLNDVAGLGSLDFLWILAVVGWVSVSIVGLAASSETPSWTQKVSVTVQGGGG